MLNAPLLSRASLATLFALIVPAQVASQAGSPARCQALADLSVPQRAAAGQLVYTAPHAVAAGARGDYLVLGVPAYVWSPGASTTKPIIEDSTGIGFFFRQGRRPTVVPRPPALVSVRDPRLVLVGPREWLAVLDEPVGPTPERPSDARDHRLWAVTFADGRWEKATELGTFRFLTGSFDVDVGSALAIRGDTITLAIVHQDRRSLQPRIRILRRIRGSWTASMDDSVAFASIADAVPTRDGVLLAFAAPDTADYRRMRSVRPSLFVHSLRGTSSLPPTVIASRGAQGITAIRLMTLPGDSVAVLWLEGELSSRSGSGTLRMAVSGDGLAWSVPAEPLATDVVSFRAGVVGRRIVATTVSPAGDSASVLVVEAGRVSHRYRIAHVLPLAPGITADRSGSIALFAVGPYGAGGSAMPALSMVVSAMQCQTSP